MSDRLGGRTEGDASVEGGGMTVGGKGFGGYKGTEVSSEVGFMMAPPRFVDRLLFLPDVLRVVVEEVCLGDRQTVEGGGRSG